VVEAAAEEVEAVAAEGAAAEPATPEVITKGKKEEAETAASAPAKK
jgi:hypothetical protein